MISPDSSQSSASASGHAEAAAKPTTTAPPPYAFATHLLGALGPVKRRHQQTLREVESLVTLIRTKAGMEEEQAKQLERMVEASNRGGSGGILASLRLGKPKSPFALGRGSEEGSALDRSKGQGHQHQEGGDGEGPESTFQACVESFKADLLKRAGQRRHLAQSLLAEVHAPIESLHQAAAAEGMELEELVAALAKELQALAKKYAQAHRSFERAHTQAGSLCQQARDQGLAAPPVDAKRVAELYAQQQAAVAEAAAAAVAVAPSPISMSAGSGAKGGFPASPFVANSPAARKIASLSNNLMHQVSRADPTSWLLPNAAGNSSSMSSTATGSSTADVAAQAQQQLEAELCRLACRDRYAELVDGTHRAAHELQVALTRYQLLEEGCIDELSKLLRKAIVFESSTLANEQYEAQTTFKVVEAVEKDKDLEAFVAAQLRVPSLDSPTAAAAQQQAADDGHDEILYFVSRSLGLSLPPPPPLPPASSSHEPGRVLTGASRPPVLKPSGLPNLSAPAPNVIPARYVLRLLRGGPAVSPAPSPPPPPPPASLPAVTMAKAAEPPSLALRSPTAATTATTTVKAAPAPLPKPPIPVARRSPMPPPAAAVVDEDDEEDDEEEEEEESDDEEEGFEQARAVVTRSPAPPTQQQSAQRSLKALVQKRHEKQRASGGVSPLVDVEEIETETGKEYAL